MASTAANKLLAKTTAYIMQGSSADRARSMEMIGALVPPDLWWHDAMLNGIRSGESGLTLKLLPRVCQLTTQLADPAGA